MSTNLVSHHAERSSTITEVNPLHPLKAPLPTLLAPYENLTVCKLGHPENAPAPISTDALVSDLPLTLTSSSELHEEKAKAPTFVTFSEISMRSRLEHPLNADTPIRLTPEGMSTLLSLVWPSKALSPILSTQSSPMTLEMTMVLPHCHLTRAIHHISQHAAYLSRDSTMCNHFCIEI